MEQWYEGLQILEHESQPLPPMERLKAINGPLLSWYKGHARMLPWRERPEPYRVWISEIMLQQTRVEAVKPYFARFMEAFPDVKALAEADDERLLKVWEGLGYYNRARNLKKAAGIMAESYGGQLPPSYEELMNCLRHPGAGCGRQCSACHLPDTGKQGGYPESFREEKDRKRFDGNHARGQSRRI